MKKNILFLLLSAFVLCTGLTSCLGDNDDSGDNAVVSSYFTVDGAYPLYTLYSDANVIVNPTPESVKSITSGKGFGNNKRVFLTCTYMAENVVEDKANNKMTINNANIQSGNYIPTLKPLLKEDADRLFVTAEDSLFTMEKLNNAWGCQQGYLTTTVVSKYNIVNGYGIVPTFNLVFDANDISENAIKVTLCNNLHCKKVDFDQISNTTTFPTSFPMKEILARVPGTDSITVTVSGRGIEAQSCKFGR